MSNLFILEYFFNILKLIFALAMYDGLLSIDIWYFLILIFNRKIISPVYVILTNILFIMYFIY